MYACTYVLYVHVYYVYTHTHILHLFKINVSRGPIEKVDNIHPTTANIVVTRNKRVIVWNVGQKFPAKSLETSLNATVTFVEFPLEEEKDVVIDEVGKREIDEKFCIEQNGYCEVEI